MQYVPFSSDIEIPFYASLFSHKINHDKLDDSARKVLGLYEIRPADSREHSCRIQIHGNALTADEVQPSSAYRAEGSIKNYNTIEDFKNSDKLKEIQKAGHTIWDAINDGTIYSCPSLLASFLVLSFADLKKYKFHYWTAFPALSMEPSWAPSVQPGSSGESKVPYKKLTPAESLSLTANVTAWRASVDNRQHGFFLAKKERSAGLETNTAVDDDFASSSTSQASGPKSDYTWTISSLSSFESGFFDGVSYENRYVCFADCSNYSDDHVAPSWPLRNLLCLVRQRYKLPRTQILCFRETPMRRDAARSVILDLELPAELGNNIATPSTTLPKVVGWERNQQGKLLSRTTNLQEYMDPTKLADSSVDLNLKLMKWRISPSLDLDRIKATSCLLLGAGTLGSYVARNLLGWGVRTVTFVDNGTVSYSNPVRQPLFRFDDCLGGGKPKAPQAAAALREIYPGAVAAGHVLSVPMLGHPPTDPAQTRADFDALRALIDAHDAVFLLMDTRESRWLPTVMAKSAGKIVLNAALGFDTYVVLRHGARPGAPSEGDTPQSTAVSDLGCYFCNDVFAPSDSTHDATLDQQCTVTRPGVAAIASALAVELLVSVLQHPQGASAPATATTSTSTASGSGLKTESAEHPLGIVPHTIRGFLSTFSTLNVTGRGYEHCSACSERVLAAYEAGGWDGFVSRALSEKGYVEEISGLAEVQRAAEAAAADVEFDEEDELEEEGDGELV